jgi:hypothetical protein
MAGMSLELLHAAVHLVVAAADQRPEDEDVKAGWTAFALFGLGLVAVGLLGWSLVRQLRKVESARKAGVYGPPEESLPSSDSEPSQP